MSGTRILRCAEVRALTGLGRSTLYDKLNAKSPRHDPHFPKPVKVGKAAVGWLATELDDWIALIASARQEKK